MDILPDTILYPVADLGAAKQTYTALLGTEPAVDSPYYVGYSVGGRDVGLVPGGDGSGPLPHFHVPAITGTIAALVATGATELQAPAEVGGGRQVAVVADADGNRIGLIQG